MMVDRRYDREGVLLGKDEVLRLRLYRYPDGREDAVVAWKGATRVTPQGYKERQELEYKLEAEDARPEELFAALGYGEINTIERYVEHYHLGEAVVRLEWYPRMDVLVEVEGSEAGIEGALTVIGLPREAYTPEALKAFADRFAERTGRPAILVAAELDGEPPSWVSR
jgi:hypothetical protein